MAQRTAKPRKTKGGAEATPQKKPKAKQAKATAEKRLNAIFESLTEELFTSLEHNYEPKER